MIMKKLKTSNNLICWFIE